MRRRVDQFPRASRLLNQLMAAVMAHVNGNPVLAIKLFQVGFNKAMPAHTHMPPGIQGAHSLLCRSISTPPSAAMPW